MQRRLKLRVEVFVSAIKWIPVAMATGLFFNGSSHHFARLHANAEVLASLFMAPEHAYSRISREVATIINASP
jgi:hypothetical protein